MKRIFLITILIVGLTATYGFADMDDHMGSGQGMMERGHSSDESSEHSEGMGPGMMGGYGMMGQGHMGGMMGGYGYRGNDPEAYEKYQKEY